MQDKHYNNQKILMKFLLFIKQLKYKQIYIKLLKYLIKYKKKNNQLINNINN